MSRKENDFLKRLLATFQGEAEERVRSLASGLIELETAPADGKQAEIIELVFREVHSLKGAARSVNLMEIESICQAMEDIFAALKQQKITPSLPLLDALHHATDVLKGLLATSQSQPASQDRARHAPLIRQLKELARNNTQSAAPASVPPASVPPASVPPASVPPASVPPLAPAPIPPITPTHDVKIDTPDTLNVSEIEGSPAQMPGAANSEWHLETAALPQPRLTSEERSAPATETIRIAAVRLESLLLQVEELVSAKLAVGQRAAELRESRIALQEWDKRWAKLYPAIRTISQLVDSLEKRASLPANGQGNRSSNGHSIGYGNGHNNGHEEKPSSQAGEWQKLKTQLVGLLEFVEWNHTWVESLETQLSAISSAAQRDQRTIGGMVDHLLQDMKQVMMLPFSSILEIFPSATREIARQQEKEVQIVIRGAEIEVDRRILQEIKDPLMHLVRNCVDHGIEPPAVRERAHKPRRGTITLTIAQRDSSKFEILVADDGGGIDVNKVRNTATRLGLISSENAERMSDQETESLIFQSGLSTSPLITDISGRGLGLAIVQEKVEKLGGVIMLENAPGQGTSFRLLLPLTLATLRGLLVRSEGQTLILPLIHVDRVARLNRSEIQTVQNRETIRLGGQAYSFVRLGQVLELPIRRSAPEPSERVLVVILNAADKRIAFWVDEIMGEQEVLMKGLGAQLARVRNIAGATVLGSGQVIPIINVPDLIKSAIHTMDVSTNVVEALPNKDKQILIVEDSITARMQLKNILELSGYTVKTAVDGLEALMALRMEGFDLVVSDVDMPRLNGLDLTTRIRSDKKLADMPVVLVTTLASRQDQERGIEAGANAYITKSNFDQNKLLDAIRRLI